MCTDSQTEIHHEGLGQAIMEAERSHSLLSASWRARSATGAIRSDIRRPEHQLQVLVAAEGPEPGAGCPKADKGCPSASGERIPLPPPFCPLWALSGMDVPTPSAETIFLTQLVIQMLISSRSTLTNTHSEIMS